MPQKDCFERRWTPHEKQIRLIHHAVHIWLLPERRRDRLTAEVTSHILLPGILKLGRARSQTSYLRPRAGNKGKGFRSPMRVFMHAVNLQSVRKDDRMPTSDLLYSAIARFKSSYSSQGVRQGHHTIFRATIFQMPAEWWERTCTRRASRAGDLAERQ
jgi:hypothetical protein